VKDVAENGGEEEQQRKDGEEPVIGNQRGAAACLIVAEFLENGKGEPEAAVSLLEPINSPDGRLDRVRPGGGSRVASSRRLRPGRVLALDAPGIRMCSGPR
jgi:hypothetical protein